MENKEISSQVLKGKDAFNIIYEYKDAEKDCKMIQIKCKTCGSERIIRKGYLERTSCQSCKEQKFLYDVVGKTVGIYTILEFVSYINYSRRYKVRCNLCGAEHIRTYENVIVVSKNCSACDPKLRASLDTPRHAAFLNYKHSAKRRNLEFDLSEEQFNDITSKSCYYCGNSPEKKFARHNRTNEDFVMSGIDRLNSSLGYSLNNCVPCCERCNRFKMAIDHDIFLNNISEIYNHLISKGSTTIETTSENDGKE